VFLFEVNCAARSGYLCLASSAAGFNSSRGAQRSPHPRATPFSRGANLPGQQRLGLLSILDARDGHRDRQAESSLINRDRRSIERRFRLISRSRCSTRRSIDVKEGNRADSDVSAASVGYIYDIPILMELSSMMGLRGLRLIKQQVQKTLLRPHKDTTQRYLDRLS